MSCASSDSRTRCAVGRALFRAVTNAALSAPVMSDRITTLISSSTNVTPFSERRACLNGSRSTIGSTFG